MRPYHIETKTKKARTAIALSEAEGDKNLAKGNLHEAIKIYEQILDNAMPSSIERAAILRKLGNCGIVLWEFHRSTAYFEEAIRILDACKTKNKAWWSCWIDIQNDYCYIYHTTSQHELLSGLINNLKKLIHQKGTKKQRIKFLTSVYLDAMQRCRWHMPPEEVIALCEMIKQLAREEGDITNEVKASNCQALAHMWRREGSEARTEALRALSLLKQFHEDEGIAVSYEIITYSYRMDNNLEAAHKWTQAALAYQQETNNKQLKVLQTGMEAWQHLKKGNIDQAEILAEQTLKYFTEVKFPFLFVALMPLISIAVSKDNIDKAAAHAFLLLHPMAQKLPPSITTRLQEGLAFWGERKTKEAKENFSLAVSIAEKEGYS